MKSIDENPQDQTVLDAALHYVGMGLKIVPIPQGQKGPRRKAWNTEDGWISTPEQVREHWASNPTDGIGVVLEPSGLVSLDVDHWADTEALFTARGLNLQDQIERGWAIQGREDRVRVIFRLPNNAPQSLMGRVVRSPGKAGYTVYELRAGPLCDNLPPTIHPGTGRPYQTVHAHPERYEDIPELPRELLALFIEHRNLVQAEGERAWKSLCWRKRYPREFEYANGEVPALLELMGAEQVSEHVYTCPFHRPDTHPSFLRYEAEDGTHLMFDTHGGEVGRQLQTGWAFLDAFDLYQQAHGLDSLQAALDHIRGVLGLKTKKAAGKLTETLTLLQEAGLKLLRTDAGSAYAELPTGDRPELFQVDSKRFLDAVQDLVYQRRQRIASRASLQELVGFLHGQALRRGERVEVFGRYTKQNGAHYIALSPGEFVQITRAGWQVVNTVPVRLLLPEQALPLPRPERGGSIELLDGLFHLSRADLIKLIVFILAAMSPVPTMRFPILAISGEQGSAKSTLTRLLKRLIDAGLASGRVLPAKEQDLAVACRNDHLLCFDNVSKLSPTISDALCRMSTGGEFAARALFTNAEEFMIHVHRPVILNGIPDLAERGDLADRTYSVHLRRIPDDQRLTEEQLEQRIQQVIPPLLGLFCDAMVEVLNDRDQGPVVGLPRLADAARLGMAAARVFGFEPAEVLDALKANSEDLNHGILESSPFALAVCNFAIEKNIWKGQITALLAAVKPIDGVLPPSWPSTPQAASNELRRLAPALRAAGIEVTWLPRRGTARLIELSRQQAPGDDSDKLDQ